MAVLVDTPRWPWRGERWAHLASDESHDELHTFAVLLGLRRLAFQGDHYDVPASLVDPAQTLGAQMVDSRVLVRRLRESGLRHRAPMGWYREVWMQDERQAGVLSALRQSSSVTQAGLLTTVQQWVPAQSSSLVVVSRPGEVGVGLTLPHLSDLASVPQPAWVSRLHDGGVALDWLVDVAG